MNVLNKRYDPAVPVDRIKPNPRNVNEGDLGQLSVSISENGFYGALIVNERTGFLVAGEHRWRSAIGEGATTLPVLFIDCDEEHERKILLADNRTSRLGCFNNYALAEELQAIQSDYGSLLGTGFDDDALAELINDLTKPLVFDKPANGGSKPGFSHEEIVAKQVFEGPTATVTPGSPAVTAPPPNTESGVPAPASWQENWKGMPDFEQNDQLAKQSIKVHFATDQDRDAFSALIQQPLNEKTKYIWYPQAEKAIVADKRYISTAENTTELPE